MIVAGVRGLCLCRDKYIEAELAKKQAVVQTGDTRSEYERMKAALYEVPENLKVCLF